MMRGWWDRTFMVILVLVAAGSIYAIWPDEPDRYLPDAIPWPSGRGVPGEIAGLQLPCHSEDQTNESDSADCKGMTLGLDLQGGSRIVLQADLQGRTDIDLDEALSAAKEIVESRINPFGVSEAQVQRSGKDRLVVELPGVSANTARDITRPAILMFCEPLQQGAQGSGAGAQIASAPQGSRVAYKAGGCEPDVDENGAVAVINADGSIGRLAPTYTTLQEVDLSSGRDNIVWTPATGDLNGAQTVMTGAFLKSNTTVQFDQLGQPFLIFNMTDDGKQVFGSLTRRVQGLPLATFLDGDPIRGREGGIIAPTVQGEITDTGQTTGLALKDAQRLKTLLNNGAFPVPLKVVQQQDVDATLGDEAVRHSVQAGIVALLIIMAFMTLYYRLPGILASGALVVYTAVVLAIFKIGIPGVGPVTLTLAGVAAFVLSVGMAVDANILIFERTREELRAGRSLIPAVEAGFERAWSSIRDSNVSTLITCAILYWMGNALASTLIKGFALTLAVGVVISMFSAITVTRTLLRLALGTPLRRLLWLWTDDQPEGRLRTTAVSGAEGAEHA
ncbi:MAG: protein translocase subunit SecD [Dehalococcoidia bacterium]